MSTLQVSGNIDGTPRYVQDASSNNSSLAISNDKIGIGTTSLGAKLDVAGDVGTSAIKQTLVLYSGSTDINDSATHTVYFRHDGGGYTPPKYFLIARMKMTGAFKGTSIKGFLDTNGVSSSNVGRWSKRNFFNLTAVTLADPTTGATVSYSKDGGNDEAIQVYYIANGDGSYHAYIEVYFQSGWYGGFTGQLDIYGTTGSAVTLWQNQGSDCGTGTPSGVLQSPNIKHTFGSDVIVSGELQANGDFITKGPWFDVRAYGATPLQLSGSGSAWWYDGTIDAANNKITNFGRFTGVQSGDSLWITNGANYGRYTISSVDPSGNYATVGTGLFTQNQTNVNWYVTTGVVDSSQAFQDALNAAAGSVGGMQSNGGVVTVPKGKFRIASRLNIPLGVSLVGAGREATILLADFAEKTGGATFVNGSNSITGITGSLAAGDYAKVAAQDFTALARIESIDSVNHTATLHVNYYGANGSGYKTVTPVIELYSTNYSSVKNLTIDTAQLKQHIGINVFHSGHQTLENVEIKNMYVGVFVSNSYTDGRNVIATLCRTGIQFGNGDPGSPDWSTDNYFYGGAAGECSEYGVRFVQAWGNFIYGMDIGYNIGPDMVAPVSLEGVNDPLGNNTLIGCFSENNDPCIIKINSPGNNIIGYNLNSGGISVTYTGTGSQNDMSTGGTFTGSTPTQYRVEIDGATGTPDTFRWSDSNGTSWNQSGVQIKILSGSISAINDNGSSTARITTASTAGLLPNDPVYLSNTTYYNGTHTISAIVDATHFDLEQGNYKDTEGPGGTWSKVRSGSISTIRNNGSNMARVVTAAPHGLSAGDSLIIGATSWYNGIHTISSVVNSTTFDLETASYIDDENTGTWHFANVLNNGFFVSFVYATGHSTNDNWYFYAGRTIYNFSGTTTGTVLLGNYEATPTGISRDMRLLSSNLGVGLASPADNLDVKGNVRVTATGDSYPTAQILNFDHNNVAFNFDSYYDTDWKSSYSGSNFRIYKVDDTLRFSYATGVAQGSPISAWSSEYDNCALSINSSGNIAIGAPYSTSTLQVNQPTTGSGSVNTNGTTLLTGNNTQFLNTFKPGDTINVSGETARTITSISDDYNLTVTVAFSSSQVNLTYGLTGGTRLAVKGNGNVGVGLNNPTNLIETGKGAQYYNTGTASQSGTTVSPSNGALFSAAMIGSIIVYNNGFTAHIMAYNSGLLTVAESGTVSQQTYAIYYAGFNVKNDGTASIGTNNPATMLHVSKNLTGAEVLGLFGNRLGGDYQTAGYAAMLELNSGGTPGMGGCARIGGVCESNSPALRKTGFGIYTDDQVELGITEKVRVTAKGLMGVGTASPSETITVSTYAAFDGVQHYNGSTYFDDTTEAKSTGGTAYQVLATLTTNSLFYVGSFHQFEKMFFDIATAGVLPGTLSIEYWNGSAWSALPQGQITDGTNKLSQDGNITFPRQPDWATTIVYGSQSMYWVRLKTNQNPTTAPTAYMTIPDDGNRFGVYAQAGDSTPALLVNKYGFTGVGTASPTAKLDVNPGTISDSNPNLRLRGVTSTAPSGGQSGDIQIYENGTTRRLYIKVNSSWRYVNLT